MSSTCRSMHSTHQVEDPTFTARTDPRAAGARSCRPATRAAAEDPRDLPAEPKLSLRRGETPPLPPSCPYRHNEAPSHLRPRPAQPTPRRPRSPTTARSVVCQKRLARYLTIVGSSPTSPRRTLRASFPRHSRFEMKPNPSFQVLMTDVTRTQTGT